MVKEQQELYWVQQALQESGISLIRIDSFQAKRYLKLRFTMLVLFCYLLLHLSGMFSMTCLAENEGPNLYVFGDSAFDIGRKIAHASGLKTGYFPYGIECAWNGQLRFTDGQTIPELIATALNSRKPISIDELRLYPDNGVVYASASAGILPETGTIFGKNYDMEQQVNLFKDTIENSLRPKSPSAHELREYLSDSIFLINIGSSDYIYNYLQSDKNNSSRHNGEEFAELLTTKLANQLKDLHKLGARKMVVFQLGPLGCLPYVINKVKPTSNCAEDVNELVSIFNDNLSTKVEELSEKLEGSSFVIARTFDLIKSMIQNPKDYGFVEIRWPCCATEENGTGLCRKPDYSKNEMSPEVAKAIDPPGVHMRQRQDQMLFDCFDLPPVNITLPRTKDGKALANYCPERKLYLFFDEIHLTQSAYKVITNQSLISTTSGGICSPFGINHLAEI